MNPSKIIYNFETIYKYYSRDGEQKTQILVMIFIGFIVPRIETILLGKKKTLSALYYVYINSNNIDTHIMIVSLSIS